jgi:hypothetical protein
MKNKLANNKKYTEANFYWFTVAWRKIMPTVAPLADKAQSIEMGGKFKSLLFQPQPEGGPHLRCQESEPQTTFCPLAATASAARYPKE